METNPEATEDRTRTTTTRLHCAQELRVTQSVWNFWGSIGEVWEEQFEVIVELSEGADR